MKAKIFEYLEYLEIRLEESRKLYSKQGLARNNYLKLGREIVTLEHALSTFKEIFEIEEEEDE